MSFPTQYIQTEPPAGGAQPFPGVSPGLAPLQEEVQFMDPVPGEAVAMLRQTRRSVGFVGLIMVTLGLLVTLPAATFAVLKWDADPVLARRLGNVALGGIVWLIPAFYLRAYARRIKRLLGYPTGDLLASALAAQKGFWRIACLLLALGLMTAAGLGGRFAWSKGFRAVSDDVRTSVMAFVGQPATAPAVPTPCVAATQPSETDPAATQPSAHQPATTQTAAPEPAVAATEPVAPPPPAATPAESSPPAAPAPSGQASVETGESPATDEKLPIGS